LVDTGATRYVCTKKRVFFIYKEVDGENLYMRNSSTSKLLEVGNVILKITFGKLLTLNNALYIADIIKNIVWFIAE
jgi:hypothetical protein